jgi:riboflavin biosynthesis pyrimidine reductase
VRQLLPSPLASELDGLALEERYATDDRSIDGDRPWLMVNMIASADGGTSVDGRSGGLGGPADKQVFAAIRAVADVVLVAAGTVRAERYGPPRPSADVRRRRRARGQSEVPRIAIVTRSLDLDLTTPLFTDADAPPYLLVPEDVAAARLEQVAERATVLRCGEHTVSLTLALEALHAEGARVVLSEGGPSLNGALVAADLVDELCLTVSPTLVAGSSARIAHGDHGVLTRLHLRHVLEEGGSLFLRYTR